MNEILEKSLMTYGADYIRCVCTEECSELIQAVCKMGRYDKTHEIYGGNVSKLRSNLLEEIADVRICIEYIKLMYGIKEENIDTMQECKIQRIAKRLEDAIC